jgi:hypothetical protein
VNVWADDDWVEELSVDGSSRIRTAGAAHRAERERARAGTGALSAQRHARPQYRPLPPYGRQIVEMLRLKLRPAILGGCVAVSLDWDLGSAWPRIVLPRDVDPHSYNLAFLAGLDTLVIYRPGHPADHIAAAVEAVKAARPHVCGVTALPQLVNE